jgi:hypothetical protein
MYPITMSVCTLQTSSLLQQKLCYLYRASYPCPVQCSLSCDVCSIHICTVLHNIYIYIYTHIYIPIPSIIIMSTNQSKQQSFMPVVSEPYTLKHKNLWKGRKHEASLHLIGIQKNSSCAQTTTHPVKAAESHASGLWTQNPKTQKSKKRSTAWSLPPSDRNTQELLMCTKRQPNAKSMQTRAPISSSTLEEQQRNCHRLLLNC